MFKRPTSFFYILSEFFFVSLAISSITTSLAFAQQFSKYFELVFIPTTPLAVLKLFWISLLPNIASVTIPMALSIGAVITCSRLSADREFLAFQASGLSRWKLAVPFFTLGLIATCIMAYLSMSLIPSSLRKVKDSRQRLSMKDVGSAIKPKGLVTAIPNVLLFLRDIDKNTGIWEGVFLISKLAKPDAFRLSLARKGSIAMPTQGSGVLEAHLTDCLSAEYSSIASIESATKSKRLVVKFAISTERAEIPSQIPYAEMSFVEISRAARPANSIQALTEWHKRLAFPLSGLLLTVASFIIATSVRGKGFLPRSRAIVSSLFLSLGYYLIFTVGQNLSLQGTLPAWFAVWGANISLLLLGGALLTKGGFVSMPRFALRPGLRKSRDAMSLRAELSSRSRLKWRYPAPFGLINLLLFASFVRYFLLCAFPLVVILIIFTLFDIIPAASKNQISYSYILSYLLLLTPQLIYISAPFSLLLALLLSFGMLGKTRQTLAFASVGQGKAQLIVPVILIGLVATFLLFYFSNSGLPTLNRLQDARHRTIKGKRSEETVSTLDRNWTYGKNNTIYGYEWLDSNNTFSGLTSFKIHNDVKLNLNNTNQAIQVSTTLWKTRKGRKETVALNDDLQISPPKEFIFTVIEDGSEIFKPTANESSKIDLKTINESIKRLNSLGLDSYSLRLDLAKRVSFPVSCLTLTLLAIPFVLSSIKRRAGTLFYVSIGASVGLIFWLLMNFFEMVGRQRWLPITLAIWAPQIIFGSLGVYFTLYQEHRSKRNS